MNVSAITVAVVFVLIAVRRIGRVSLRIWQIMLGGALVVLVTGQIPPAQAVAAINPDVMLFLFGMFVVGQALEDSGYLFHLAYKLFRRTRTVDGLVLAILFGMGAGSAVLMNDTLAVIGTPLVLLLARQHRVDPKLLLLTLAFAITLGSVTSPIGNPQNLLIAVQGGIPDPFGAFLHQLGLPTLINLGLTYAVLRLSYRDRFHGAALQHEIAPITDPGLARLSRLALAIILVLIAAKIAMEWIAPTQVLPLTPIALAAALPILLFSPRRLSILKRIDWPTLAFFAAMFVLMESAGRSGVFQSALHDFGMDTTRIPSIVLVSTLLSQLISNVPLVALYLPILLHAGAPTPALLALAAGSTIAGNLFILGAASNVIIIQNAERRAHITLGFLEFARVGLPVAAVNGLVYWVFLRFF